MTPDSSTALTRWQFDLARWRSAIRRMRKWARRRRAARLAPLERVASIFGVTDPLVAHNWTIGVRPILAGEAFDAAVAYLQAAKDDREDQMTARIADQLWNRWLVPYGMRARDVGTGKRGAGNPKALPERVAADLIAATV